MAEQQTEPLGKGCDDKKTELQLDYAWKWFDFHAKQRTTMFNFFMAFTGLFLNGIFLLLKEKHFYDVAVYASVAGMIITFAFFALDIRNRKLVGYAEEVLFWLERDQIFNTSPLLKDILEGKCPEKEKQVRLSLYWREKQENGMRGAWAQHCVWISVLQGIVFCGFAGLTIYIKWFVN